MEITTIRQPVGAGRIRKVVNVECDRLNKRSILCIPTDSLGLCCAKAVVFAIAHLDGDRRSINAMKDRRRPALETRARELHKKAGIPLGPCTFAEVARFEKVLDIQIVVISTEERNGVAYRGRDRSRRINLWLHNGHYDVIKSLKGFFASNHYCERCEKPFENLENHRCPMACHICLRVCCSAKGVPKRCFDCDRLCQSLECYAAYKALTGNQELSICNRMYQCRKCCSVIRRRDCPKELHVCGSRKCPSCQKFVVLEEHLCCLPRVSPKKSSSDIIFFDLETGQSSGEHVVNFAVAQYSDGREMVFRGYSACKEFCTWLFSPKHKGHTVIAHNMKGFDGQFIVGWMLEQGTSPSVIPIGSKLMSIRHPSLGITIIDSMSFLQMSLSKLPNCFGLSELKKGYFPHLFNVRENQNYAILLCR
ncbi:hypothetical protein AVEN_105708-1 [Araneus ventricosus]|uniref:DNA-directed DNA polymerase n=1 Tax=Araneus ventricosus TaxID=182803 RepID=A0A4Y2U3D5_ARAVE|nr:hypothetical protein AVEN_105708-1 [Araneus ventricosus]